MFCWCVATAAVLAPWPGVAACAPKLPFCQSRPSRTDQTVAIFVGKVKSVTMPAATPAAAPREPRTSQAEFLSGRNHIRVPIQSANGVPTNSDAFLGSIPQGVPAFSDGEAWLVEAYYDAHLQQWMTSTCQRTKPVSQASDDLQALRAWIAGNRLPGRVQGQVANPEKAPGLLTRYRQIAPEGFVFGPLKFHPGTEANLVIPDAY